MNAYMVTPELTRAAVTSCIGSFVSRDTFVDREGARRVVGVLYEFLNAHLESVEQALRAGWGTFFDDTRTIHGFLCGYASCN